jgi:hypothetical protein
MLMHLGEFWCIFGSDQAVVKLEFRERISADEEPDKLQCSLFVSHSASMLIFSHLLNSFQSTRGGMCSFLDCIFSSLDCTIGPFMGFTFCLDCTLKVTTDLQSNKKPYA